MRQRIKQSQGNRGQSLVEFTLLLPVVIAFTYASFLFYQGFVQANLYARNAENYNYYMEENPAFGQEMVVALPFP
jgi:hypothetical protein